MAILNNLYPPIVDTYMPAFLVDSASLAKNVCRVYFSISLYNSLSDIKNAQVTIYDQNTNISVLKEKSYPCSIMLTNIYEDVTRTSDDKYYIEIKKSDIENEQFEINRYYKVQIRFTSAAAASVNLSLPQAIDSWLAANQSLFSEWSTICLVRGISTPTLAIPGFENTADYTTWNISTIDIAGKLTFLNTEETETLKQYQIKLYNEAEEELTDSGIIYANNYVGINEINYTFKYAFQDGEKYTMTIEYLTKNLYSGSATYNFMVMLGVAGKLDATVSALEDEENGRIGVAVKGNTLDYFTGNITIRRTSSESNFTLWEDIHTLSIENKVLDFVWYDSTIKSGVWYKYCAQKRDSFGNRGVISELKNPVMVTFENMYLTAGGKQLNIKFNPQISSFKYVVADSKTDTIGSKYPFIKRNGYMYYRQFPISGLISHFMDEDNTLTSKEEIYEDSLELYEEYNDEHRIIPYNDYTLERDFRDKVEAFLNDNKVKMFRSATEGNILVKLTDINYTPEQALGRMIYSFSCTAHEIAECTTENCNLYNIQPLGEIDEELAYKEEFNGQLNEAIPAGTDVIQVLQEKYNKLMKEGYICKVEYLDYLKIEMEEDPYLIKENNNGLEPMALESGNTNPYPIDDDPEGGWDTEPASAYLGYIAKINGEYIVINPEGIYELKGEGIRITSLIFPVDTQINFTYHISISQTEDKTQLPKTTDYYKKVGQKWGVFEYKDSIFQAIWNKYYEQYTTYIQSMLSLSDIKVEADPGTVVYVAETKELDFSRHIIGDTCMLTFEDPDSSIIGLYFAGIHFEEATEYEKNRDLMPDHRYIDTGLTISSLDEIENPIKNGVYILQPSEENIELALMTADNTAYDNLITRTADKKFAAAIAENLTNNQYIWYNDKWWLFTDTHDLLCPVEALIDYTCELSKGWYEI